MRSVNFDPSCALTMMLKFSCVIVHLAYSKDRASYHALQWYGYCPDQRSLRDTQEHAAALRDASTDLTEADEPNLMDAPVPWSCFRVFAPNLPILHVGGQLINSDNL